VPFTLVVALFLEVRVDRSVDVPREYHEDRNRMELRGVHKRKEAGRKEWE